MRIQNPSSILFLTLTLTSLCVGQEAYLLEELTAERHVVAQGGYFPRLLVLPSGDLLAAFKHGTAHVAKGGKAGIAKSKDGGRSWSTAKTIFSVPGADSGVSATGQSPDGTIFLGLASETWPGEIFTRKGIRVEPYLMKSIDEGKTWSKPEKLNFHPFTWGLPFGHIHHLPDGTLLLTGYGGYLPQGEEDSPAELEKLLAAGKKPSKPEEHRGNFCFLIRSRDAGKTWGDLTVIARRYNEVSLLPLGKRKMLAMMRSQEGGHLAQTVSDDNGYHWSPPKRITKDREHPADLLQLASGSLVLTYGQRNKPYGIQAMISHDHGQTWSQQRRVMLAWDGDHTDLGYPVTVQRADGKLVTVYYIVYGEKDVYGTKTETPKNAYTKVVIWEPPRDW